MNSPLPVFVSDDRDAFSNALLEVYGIKETPEYKGIGRKPNPILVPPPNLKYSQIVKYKANDEVIGISRCLIDGDPKKVMELLCPMSKGISIQPMPKELTSQLGFIMQGSCEITKSANF